MRTIIIVTGRDYGTITGEPTPDGKLAISQWTKIEITPYGNPHGQIRIDGQVVGDIQAIVIDHEDEKAPPPEATP